MTKDQAVDWAIGYVQASLSYEHYRKEEHAIHAAQAMSILTGNPWHVVKDEHRYCVVRVKDQSPT